MERRQPHARRRNIPARLTLSLALGEGEAGSLAHVLVLEEKRLRPAVLDGTSIGAVVGALYADGISATEIRYGVNSLMHRESDFLRLVVLLDQPSAHQSDDDEAVGESCRPVGTAPALAVKPLPEIIGPNPATIMDLRKTVKARLSSIASLNCFSSCSTTQPR